MIIAKRCQLTNRQKQSTWANISLALAATVFTFLVAEFVSRVLHLSPHGFAERKLFIYADLSRPTFCYPTNPRGYFPIDLSTETGRATLAQLAVTEAEAKQISEITPYCVVSNQQRRRSGDFPGREHTVAIIGDSFAFGEGLKDEHTLAHLMTLKTENVNYRSFARSGATIPMIAEELTDVIVSAPEAQKVIYFYNLNDMYETDSLKSTESEINDLQNIRWDKKVSGSWARVIQKSRFISYLWQRLILREQTVKTIEWYNALYKSEENQFSREQAFADILKIRQESQNAGKQFTMVLYPLLYKRPDGEYPFAEVHAIMMNFCARSGLHCLDASHAFDDSRTVSQFTVHPLDFHPNELANQKVADYLFVADRELFR